MTLREKTLPILERLVGRKLATNIVKLMTGTVIGLAINFFVTPILTRLYTPSDFGVLGTITALVATFSGISAWRYGMAIVLPEDDRDAINVFALATFALLVSTALLTVTFVGFGTQIAQLYSEIPNLEQWMWAVPVLVFVTAVYQVSRFWFTRTERFATMSAGAVTGAVFSSGSKLIGGWNKVGVGGLIVGQLIGQVVASALMGLTVAYQTRKLIGSVSIEKMKSMAKTYSDFPRYNVPITFINASAKNLPVFGLGWFFSAQVVGWYGMAYMLINLPVYLVTDALRQTFYQKANKTFQDRGDLRGEIVRLTAVMFGIGLFPAVIFAAFAPTILETFLGSEWTHAGEYARILTLYLFTFLIVTPASTVLPVLRQQRAALVWQVFSLTGTAVAIFVGGAMESDLLAIGLFSISGATMNLILVFYVVMILRNPEKIRTYDENSD